MNRPRTLYRSVVLLLACSLLSVCNGTDSASTRQAAYSSSHGLAFTHPASWKLEQENWKLWSYGSAMVSIGIGKNGILLVQLRKIEPDEPLDAPIDTLPADAVNDFPRTPEIRHTPGGQRHGYLIAEEYKKVRHERLGGIEVETRQLGAVKRIGSHQVIVRLLTPDDKFESARAGFEQVLTSLSLRIAP